MNQFRLRFFYILILIGLFIFPAYSGVTGEVLKFNFELNHPLTYLVTSKETSIANSSGQVRGRTQNALISTTIESICKIKLTPVKKSKDGIWTIHYEPFDFSENKNIFSPTTETIITSHGLEIQETQNGIMIIDTTNGIGENQAKTIRLSMYPNMLSGYMDFNASGQVIKIDGDLPFIDYWTNRLKPRVGFFDLQFSPRPVTDGGSWTESLPLTALSDYKLGDKGLVITNIYSRELAMNNANMAIISLGCRSALNSKNITGSIEQSSQTMKIDISELSLSSTGKGQFDSKRGWLLIFSKSDAVYAAMTMLVQGNLMNTTVDLHIDTSFELLPDQP